MLLISIDPGKQGGISLLQDQCGEVEVRWAHPLPNADSKGWAQINELLASAKELGCKYAALERQWGRAGNSMPTTFKMGIGYGFIMAALINNEIEAVEIEPSLWMSKVPCLESSIVFPSVMKDTKRRSITWVRQMYPHIQLQTARKAWLDGVADSIALGCVYFKELRHLPPKGDKKKTNHATKTRRTHK